MATKAKRLCGLPKFSTELDRGHSSGMDASWDVARNVAWNAGALWPAIVCWDEMEADVCDSPGNSLHFCITDVATPMQTWLMWRRWWRHIKTMMVMIVMVVVVAVVIRADCADCYISPPVIKMIWFWMLLIDISCWYVCMDFRWQLPRISVDDCKVEAMFSGQWFRGFKSIQDSYAVHDLICCYILNHCHPIPRSSFFLWNSLKTAHGYSLDLSLPGTLWIAASLLHHGWCRDPWVT